MTMFCSGQHLKWADSRRTQQPALQKQSAGCENFRLGLLDTPKLYGGLLYFFLSICLQCTLLKMEIIFVNDI